MEATNTQLSSFSNGQSENFGNTFSEKLKKYWEAFQYYVRQVWPFIHTFINFIVYQIIKVIKAIVKIGLQQVGMFKE